MYFTDSISSKKKIPVSLITTLYNEEKALYDFLDSLLKMSVLPQEIVIVDGGSKDRTIDILEEFKDTYINDLKVQIIIDPTCTIYYTPAPIAKGRNIAIRRASHEIIAVTDAGCLVHTQWLEEITKPFFQNTSTQFVAGWYEPLAKSYFEECQALATFQVVKAVDPKKFLPSSRSVAFTKAIWKEVNGYPELALGGEDTLFDVRVKETTKGIVFVPEAIVFWRLRPNFKIFVKLVFRYGFGDGFCRLLFMNFVRNTVKLAVAIGFFVFGIIYSVEWFAAFVLYLWLLPFNGNLREAFRIKHIMKYPTVAFLKIVSNTSYLIGYAKGLMTKDHPTFEKINDHKH